MSKHLTDFNDLHVSEGIEAVRGQLIEALASNDVEALAPAADDFYDQYEPAHAHLDVSEPIKKFGQWSFIELLENVSLIYGTDTVWDARERIQMRLSHLRHIIGREMYKTWDEHPFRKIIKGLVFEPSGEVPAFHANLFNGFAIAPGTQGARGCPKILNHIYRLCGHRDDEFEWLIRWIAYPLQNPGAKMDTSVVMHGSEGPGKSLLWERVVARIYGKYAITVGQAQIESQFTGWQSGKCFALCEEVVARNEKSHYKGMIKHLVTGGSLMINEKNLPAREEANHMNSVFLSNSQQPLELDVGDRRFLVLHITDVPPAGYFDALFHEIDNGGIEEFYAHLLQLDMKGFYEHSKPPLNAEKQHLIEAGMPNALLFYQDWKDGLLGMDYGPCPVATLYSAYRRWCDQRNEFKQRDRTVKAELRRYLTEDRVDIKLPDDFKERKTTRVWVPHEIAQRKGEQNFVRDVELACQAFLKSFDGSKDENDKV